MASTDTSRPVPSPVPSPDTDRPLRADARRNRERVIEAAAEVFAEHGADAQMDDVAKRAGCGMGTVYRHFKDKDALAGELVRRHFEHLAVRAEHWVATESPRDPWGAFEGFVREAADGMARDVAQQRMIWTVSPEGFAVAASTRDRLVEHGARLIAAAQDAGELRADFTIADMPTVMCALGSAMQVIDPETGTPRDWRRLLDFVLDGVRAR